MTSLKSFFGVDAEGSIGLGPVYALGAFLFPLTALWNARAVVPLAAVIALAALIVLIRGHGPGVLKNIDKVMAAGAAGLLVAAVSAALIAPDLSKAIVSTLKVTGNVVVATVLLFATRYLTGKEATRVVQCLFAATLITGGFFLADIISEGALSLFFTNMTYTPKYKYFWFKSASSTFSLCILICGLYLTAIGRKWAALALAGIAVFIGFEIGNRTAGLGVAAGLGAASVYHLLGRWRPQVLGGALVIAFAAPIYLQPPIFSAEGISNALGVRTSSTMSVVYRMYAWEFVAQRIAEHPISGWGLDASKQFGGEESEKIISDPLMGPLGEPVPLHPHNGILQLWLETGILGALAMLVLIVRGTRLTEALCTRPAQRIWAFSVVFLLLCFFGFSYSVFSSAWLMSAALTASMLSAACRQAVPATDDVRGDP